MIRDEAKQGCCFFYICEYEMCVCMRMAGLSSSSLHEAQLSEPFILSGLFFINFLSSLALFLLFSVQTVVILSINLSLLWFEDICRDI